MALMAAVLLVHAVLPSAFNLSNTLGDGMVLQRHNGLGSPNTVIWGFGEPGETVTTTFQGVALLPPATVDSASIWRQALPILQANSTPTTLLFKGSGGGSAQLKDVLVGDVFLCSGVRAMHLDSVSTPSATTYPAEIAAPPSLSRSNRTCNTRRAAWLG